MSEKKTPVTDYFIAHHVSPDLEPLEAQYLRKLNQAENILNAIEELLKKEYRGQPEMALVKQLIAEYRKEWS